MVNPCRAGFSAVRVSTKTRASASYRSGKANTTAQPIKATTNAAINANQRNRQAPRTSSNTWSNAGVMNCPVPSKSCFRHYEYIARFQKQILFHVPAVDECIKFYFDLNLFAIFGSHDMGPVAG